MNDLPEDMEVKRLLKNKADYFVAPSNLRDRLSQHTKMPEQPGEVGIKILSWLVVPVPQLATSFALGALVASLTTGIWVSGQQDQKSMLLALAADHAHAVVAQNTVEVLSSNMHTVKPWLSSQLGYSPLVFDLGEQGFPLIGGRRGFIGSTPVAVAVYSYRQHEIDVYALTPSMYQKFPSNLESMDGFNIVSWEAEGLNYVAISDMNPNQMKIFSKLLNSRQAIRE